MTAIFEKALWLFGCILGNPRGGGAVLPYIGYIGMCGAKGPQRVWFLSRFGLK